MNPIERAPGITENVPLDFIENWLKEHADLVYVKAGLIAIVKPSDVKAASKDLQQARTGLEPLTRRKTSRRRRRLGEGRAVFDEPMMRGFRRNEPDGPYVSARPQKSFAPTDLARFRGRGERPNLFHLGVAFGSRAAIRAMELKSYVVHHVGGRGRGVSASVDTNVAAQSACGTREWLRKSMP